MKTWTEKCDDGADKGKKPTKPPSDYEIRRETRDRKQQIDESFKEFYAEIHNITFRLRKKIPGN